MNRHSSSRSMRRVGALRWCGALLALALGACVSAGVRGHAPFATINALKLDGLAVELDLGLRNPNSAPLLIRHIEFSIRVEDTSLAVYKAASQASVLANGVENLRFQLHATPEGAALLSGLERGERASLAFTLKGVMTTEDKMELKLDREGYLYPVPGRPGQFR